MCILVCAVFIIPLIETRYRPYLGSELTKSTYLNPFFISSFVIVVSDCIECYVIASVVATIEDKVGLVVVVK